MLNIASSSCSISSFFFNDTATTETYTLSLHDALPISSCSKTSLPSLKKHRGCGDASTTWWPWPAWKPGCRRSEEHTSELQSRFDLVCRLLLEKKKPQQLSSGSRHYSRDTRKA